MARSLELLACVFLLLGAQATNTATSSATASSTGSGSSTSSSTTSTSGSSTTSSANSSGSGSASSSASSSSSSSSAVPSAWRIGIATFYGGAPDGRNPSQPSIGTSVGSCGYGVLDKSKYPYWSVAALSTQNMYFLSGPTQGCGECFEIQCIQNGDQFQGRCNTDPNARSVTVMITDSCPECEPDHIDIQALTFNKMAPMAGGRVEMQYRRVNCAPPSNLSIIVDHNLGTGKWLRLTVQEVGGPGSIKLVQVEGADGKGWYNMDNYFGAAWELSQMPPPPLDLRIVDANGNEVTAYGIINRNGQTGTIPAGVQFAFTSATSSYTTIQPLPNVQASDGPPQSGSTSTARNPPASSGGLSAPAPPPKSSNSPPQAASGSTCTDVAPSNSQYTCPQQKAFGQCSASWMTQGNYCMMSCGRCSSG